MSLNEFKSDAALEEFMIAVLTVVNHGLSYKIGSVQVDAIELFTSSIKSLF